MSVRPLVSSGAATAEPLPEVKLLLRFRTWVLEVFETSQSMFEALAKEDTTTLTVEPFVLGCLEHGFQEQQPDFDLQEVYALLDADGGGEIQRPEVACLDSEEQTVKTAIAKVKSRNSERKMRLLGHVWHCGGLLPPTHRSARRPWQAETFERLPALACERRARRRLTVHRRNVEARQRFAQHLVAMHGHEVRAWRKELDPDENFVLKHKVFANYCRRTEAQVEPSSLWKALDRDGDNVIRLEELAPEAAEVLAKFREWAHNSFGSCGAIWEHSQLRHLRENVPAEAKWPTRKKMLVADVITALTALECPQLRDGRTKRHVICSLDVYGCGFVEARDFQWLDRWDPPAWIVQEPDPEAWEELRRLMLKIYKHPLRAWRSLLDADDSNQVSWEELKDACERIRFQGNIGGVWRHLDSDLSGSISMREYDERSSELLESFKQWCDVQFGSARQCFYALYDKNQGVVMASVLRKACRRLRWEGDPKELMEFLDLDKHSGASSTSKKTLVLKDIVFLDKWVVEVQDDEDLGPPAPPPPVPVLQRSASAPGNQRRQKPACSPARIRRRSSGKAEGSPSAGDVDREEDEVEDRPPSSSTNATAKTDPALEHGKKGAGVEGDEGAAAQAVSLPYLSELFREKRGEIQRIYAYSNKPKRIRQVESTPWLTKLLNFE
eukprot:TRINITY_DN19012_c0_g1_i1.p1 TRINITY_DN19012_c0_g1~~TRINITY_DN19012_c0_g1_i1.p1  ORF type:complete len:668 (-),score=138.09 TRINITY_DN19012_c0_g1_i1:13-2016(-)